MANSERVRLEYEDGKTVDLSPKGAVDLRADPALRSRRIVLPMQRGKPGLIDLSHPKLKMRRFETSIRARQTAVALSPDEGRAAVAFADFRVCTYDTESCQPIVEMSGHRNRIVDLAFSKDGSRLVSGGSDHVIRVWNVLRGVTERTLPGHEATVVQLDWSEDGRFLLSRSEDGSIRLWNLDAESDPSLLKAHDSYVYPVAFDPSGEVFATGGWDKAVRLWKASTRELLWETPNAHVVLDLSFSPSGDRLMVQTVDRDIRFLDRATGREIAVHTLNEFHANAGGWISDELVWLVRGPSTGSRLPGAASNPGVALVDPTSGVVSRHLGTETGIVSDLALSPSRRLAATAHMDGTIWLWDPESWKAVRSLRGHDSEAVSVTFDPNGAYLVSTSLNGEVLMWSLPSVLVCLN